ncbi:hypothetical protein [Ruminococcus sp. XPD3002]|uniref:hypothetical protein n=1 Tax=Ruminococcus sp. XPD3002 TaxID=1452269 RepID=UPI000918A3F9|nr:hypothetical protein SAMN04487832_10592 [Ruminococcus flavefaciens]
MEYIERMQWIEACQMFFDAYAKFQIDGTEAHWYECNYRNIEIAFIDCGFFVKVQLYCPEVLRSLNGYYGRLAKNTEEIIRMLYWLAWEADKSNSYVIKTADPEEEYQQLRRILTEKYRLCYDAYWEKDHWKETGEERVTIKLHSREIEVHFSTNAMWEGYIDADLFCCKTDRRCSTVVPQEEEEPKEIIRLLQDMASEPEILEFSTADSEWEHELIRDYLVSNRTNDGLLIERFPFGWFHSLKGVVFKERILVLHNRQIRLKFEPQEDTLQIIVDCMETGKQFTMELPKRCREVEEIGEELVWRIQELAWEAA